MPPKVSTVCFTTLEQFKQAYPDAYEKNVHVPPMGHLGDAELEIGRVCVQLASLYNYIYYSISSGFLQDLIIDIPKIP